MSWTGHCSTVQIEDSRSAAAFARVHSRFDQIADATESRVLDTWLGADYGRRCLSSGLCLLASRLSALGQTLICSNIDRARQVGAAFQALLMKPYDTLQSSTYLFRGEQRGTDETVNVESNLNGRWPDMLLCSSRCYGHGPGRR